MLDDHFTVTASVERAFLTRIQQPGSPSHRLSRSAIGLSLIPGPIEFFARLWTANIHDIARVLGAN
jgi:hypothetical protein